LEFSITILNFGYVDGTFIGKFSNKNKDFKSLSDVKKYGLALIDL